MSTTPASTEGTSTSPVREALIKQIQLTTSHTQQLEAAAVAVQGLQAQVQPLQASVDTLAAQQVVMANQQVAIMQQLQDIMNTLSAQQLSHPAPANPGNRPPGPTASINLQPLAAQPLAPGPRETCLASPRPFDGDFETCATFLMQCELVFTHQPSMFTTDTARMAYVTNLLTGRAAQWATASWSMGAVFCATYRDFVAELRKVFHHPTCGQDRDARLSSMQQGSASVTEYSVEFRLAAAESGWNDQSLRSTFRRGLSEGVKDQLATREEPPSLDELIALAIRIDGRIRKRRRKRNLRGSSFNPGSASVPDAVSTPAFPFKIPASVSAASPPVAGEERMELGRTRLSPAERENRFRAGLCLYCGQKGHRLRDCPSRPKE